MTDPLYTHLAILADRSASMQGIHTDMNGAIRKLLVDQSKEDGYCVVDITTFDAVVEFPYEHVRPDEVKKDIIEPRGRTALNDAIGMTIIRLGKYFAELDEENRPATVIFAIVTDGMENASREFTLSQVRDLIKIQTEKWNWTFMYLGANVDVDSVVHSYGLNPNMSMAYTATAASVGTASGGLSANIARVRKGKVDGFTDEERDNA
jgi:hypothetical protein